MDIETTVTEDRYCTLDAEELESLVVTHLLKGHRPPGNLEIMVEFDSEEDPDDITRVRLHWVKSESEGGPMTMDQYMALSERLRHYEEKADGGHGSEAE